ncbi:hypothetical protein AVEN_53217-1 [Araneus ventricosus]|uniref:Uncharacterized protein n=1 Tax=Araneus ventricosus TaxID=182803 RepID=A0A4Y2AB11_ARAVE|nr:hypothetical protein AVEN_53217-1 [Araneus ventricosus]
MYAKTTPYLAFCLVGFYMPSVLAFGPMKQPDMMSKGISEGEKMKGVADENDMSEEQFFKCFSDINCNLGPGAKAEMFKCYNTPSKEEIAEYGLWFKDCPVGEFERYDVTTINTAFCKLNEKDQKTLNEYFAEEAGTHIKEICADRNKKDQCKRLKEGAQCISELMERYIAEGKCETIVNEVPKPPILYEEKSVKLNEWGRGAGGRNKIRDYQTHILLTQTQDKNIKIVIRAHHSSQTKLHDLAIGYTRSRPLHVLGFT